MLNSFWNDDAQEQYLRAFDRHETYIPFRPADLGLLIVQELAAAVDKRQMEEDIDLLNELNRRLSYVTKLRVARRFDEWQDSYVMLDPDVDVLLHESHTARSGNVAKCNDRFQRTLKRALDNGSFEKLTERDLIEAENTQSILGLEVALPNKSEIQTVLFARGRRCNTIELRDWRTLWMKKTLHEVKTYQRVVLLVRRENVEEAPECWLTHYLPWNTEQPLSKAVQPGKMYLKIFKDIAASDVDMLIPGSKVKFTDLDFLLLILPLLVGIISAIWKLGNGTLDFDSMAHAMTSAGLVILPLTYAARAYMQFRIKRNTYQANLIKKLSLQTVANNSGALTAILDEVADQETMDVLLAYAFLWRGLRVPQVMPRSQLGLEVEEFLNRLLRQHGVDTKIVFDAKCACERLEELGLFQRFSSTPGETWVQVVDIGTALDALSTVNLSRPSPQDSFGSSKRVTTEYEELNISVS